MLQDYNEEQAAKDAIENMNGKTFENQRIEVKQAVRREPRQPRGGFMGDRGGDRGGKRGPQPEDVCHNCQGLGHWANMCDKEKKPMG